MDTLLYLLPTLGCPLAMGALLWLMMRPGKSAAGRAGNSRSAARDAEIAALRTEVSRLRVAQPDAGRQR